MPEKNRIVRPGFKIGTVLAEDGSVLVPPADWEFLAAGDGPLTLNVKKRGPCWQVQVQKGRRTISKGIWTAGAAIAAGRESLAARRASPEHERRLAAARKRREVRQQEYEEDFYQATLDYLAFHPDHQPLARQLARLVADHATPVGSGTVARTERIPLGRRVEAALIAWLRHQTTAYDSMRIPRIKGKRREIRRMLARHSKELLDRYRAHGSPDPDCPLLKALVRSRSVMAEESGSTGK